MAHATVGSPFGEFYLCHQLWLDPLHWFISLWRIDKRTRGRFPGLHQLVNVFERLLIKTSASVCDVMQLAILIESDDQRAKIGTRISRLRVAAYDDF